MLNRLIQSHFFCVEQNVGRKRARALRCFILWTVTLLPASWWFGSAPLASAQSWKTGQSTFDGRMFTDTTPAAVTDLGLILPEPAQSQFDNAATQAGYVEQVAGENLGANSSSSQLQAAPYTVPVDPSLYTRPLVQEDVQEVAAKSTGSVNKEIVNKEIVNKAIVNNTIVNNAIAKNAITNAGFNQPLDDSDGSENAIQPIPIFDTTADKSIELSQYRQTVNNKIKTGVVGSPPLSQQTTSWYTDAWRWVTTGWTNHIELGIDGSEGNSDTFAFQTGAEIRRKTDVDTLAFDFDYRSVTSRDITTEDNGRFNVDYDRLINGTPWSLFSKFGLEWDEFKVFDLRLNLSGGLGYHWIRNDRSTFVTRFGAGASREIGAPDDDWVPEALLGFEGEHQVNQYNKIRAKVDYFPDWGDFGNYRVVSDFSWEILIGGSDNLSLKLGLNDRYDSTPQGGADANDFFYSLLLLVKL